MNKTLNIREMSELTGLTAHTLRYYEKAGLLAPVSRDGQGYRSYTERDVEWVRFLRLLRDMDMPIQEMKRYSDLRSAGDSTVTERRLMLEEHQERVRRQLERLKEDMEKVEDKIRLYKQMEERVEAGHAE
ncbi:MerR family transcriptional regulator [Paenibacillus stellifer]|uniref:MerR family transcriptional regulator n=1 Tax=Paenibacillus stellifer TaxID=169760 RepID=A0A089LN99_9BACL|nr:MerR family transcriptional regulator [Paenibacillus stellifer]AIQ62352.1 MerR family transcriptional regulator [Paenibacillus stellifer]